MLNLLPQFQSSLSFAGLLFVLLCLVGSRVGAQPTSATPAAPIDQRSADWYNLALSYGLNDRWFFNTNNYLRQDELFQNVQQLITHMEIHWQPFERVIFGKGISYNHLYRNNRKDGLAAMREVRMWNEVFWFTPLPVGRLQHRLRQEHRLMQTTHDAKFRFFPRTRFRAEWAFSLLKQKTDNKLRGYLGNELFFNLGGGIMPGPFDRNRAWVSMGWVFNPNVEMRLGYVNQYAQIRDNHYQNMDALHTQLIVRINRDQMERRERIH